MARIIELHDLQYGNSVFINVDYIVSFQECSLFEETTGEELEGTELKMTDGEKIMVRQVATLLQDDINEEVED